MSKELLQRIAALEKENQDLKAKIRDIAGTSLTELNTSIVVKMDALARSFEIPDNLVPDEYKSPDIEIPDEDDVVEIVEIPDEDDIVEVLAPIEID
jgi:hypothetical protein